MEVDTPVQPEAGPSNINVPNITSRIFANMTFKLLGEARSANVKESIENAGGKVLRTGGDDMMGIGDDDDDENVDIVLVRLVRYVSQHFFWFLFPESDLTAMFLSFSAEAHSSRARL